MGFESGTIAAAFNYALYGFVVRQGLGKVSDAETGLQIFPWAPRMIRRADVAVILGDRVPPRGPGHLKVAPDLVVEVVSTHDEAEDVEEKVRDYLRAGVRLVWVAYPRTRTIQVRRPDGRDTTVGAEDTLEGEDVLPGFSCPVAELLPA